MTNLEMDEQPVLPLEITDIIIDHLCHDVQALGNCGIVCSEWLIRSRHHLFSTVQLWPWRVRSFFSLAASKDCTFANHINRIEIDDRRVRTREHSGKESRFKGIRGETLAEEVLFRDTMSQTDIPCLAQVKSMQVRNVDWTTLSPTQRVVLRGHLAKFHKLDRLEFQNVTFHDLREVVRVVNSFPSLCHLTANITFTKYIEHAISSAKSLSLSTNLRSIELGTEDGIPVVLTCVERWDRPERLVRLRLEHIKFNHLQYIQPTLRKLGKYLREISLAFVKVDHDFIDLLDFSHLSDLRRLESPFLASIEIKCRMECEADAESIDWSRLERVLLALHFFGLEIVQFIGEAHAGSPLESDLVERWVYGGMPDLRERGVLGVRVAKEEVETLSLEDAPAKD
ncbi:hypothetical protein M413DRAFT_28463 [Hebeloma cylindrosporum]|uniref:F-box domain-containing protein n=1 Tax=Hebeloma cylindrosporum TaxID=76867 RepID=A0A0C2XSK1_HEBCY|nr:hypothetical protein M413DRAFT_28463 [Hebeloma cylindrosporum h7]